jgi:predicted ArsR family transcriptional regulator
MHDARFFQSTRGRIVAALRRRRGAAAIELAEEFGLSANAVRQQLLFLERDGYVVERAVKRGPTKPTLEYSLTAEGEALFPHHYDRILNAVLREIRESYGAEAVEAIFARLGERSALNIGRRTSGNQPRDKVEALASILREQGVEAEVIDIAGGFELREHNCPYAKTVSEHPEICGLIHAAMDSTMPGKPLQIESIATGGSACRFEIRADAPFADVAKEEVMTP